MKRLTNSASLGLGPVTTKPELAIHVTTLICKYVKQQTKLITKFESLYYYYQHKHNG